MIHASALLYADAGPTPESCARPVATSVVIPAVVAGVQKILGVKSLNVPRGLAPTLLPLIPFKFFLMVERGRYGFVGFFCLFFFFSFF